MISKENRLSHFLQNKNKLPFIIGRLIQRSKASSLFGPRLSFNVRHVDILPFQVALVIPGNSCILNSVGIRGNLGMLDQG